MNSLKLDNSGGLQFYQNTLAYLQAGLKEALAGICKALGNNVIVSGCEIVAGNISAGEMFINDEFVKFSGGTNLGYVQIQDSVTNKVYKDGISRPLYQSRTAIPAASGTAIGDFVRLKTLKQLSSDQGFIVPFAKYHFDSGIFPAPGEGTNKNFTINHGLNITGNYYVIPSFYYTGENPPNPNGDWYRGIDYRFEHVTSNQLSLTINTTSIGNIVRLRALILFYRP